ncbi:MAG: sulfatase-like hydrolase/transferase [Verrucomicrobia bacterium]|nr:sulfatase-like hydrolase/transferase [Verrucomicrobiota bacterium]
MLFVSDNGACPYDRRSVHMDREPYDPYTTWGDSTGWAWARNSPFRYYKQNQFEGGISSPAIVHWPKGLKVKAGSITHQPAHLIDVLPTLVELGETELPKQWPGRELEPVSGISLLSILAGKTINKRPPIHLLFGADRGLRDGDWKLVSFRSGPWELYNLATDRTELNNLATKYPERVNRMSALWHEMAENVLKAPAKSREPVATEIAAHDHPEWTDFSKPLSAIGKREKNQ